MLPVPLPWLSAEIYHVSCIIFPIVLKKRFIFRTFCLNLQNSSLELLIFRRIWRTFCPFWTCWEDYSFWNTLYMLKLKLHMLRIAGFQWRTNCQRYTALPTPLCWKSYSGTGYAYSKNPPALEPGTCRSRGRSSPTEPRIPKLQRLKPHSLKWAAYKCTVTSQSCSWWHSAAKSSTKAQTIVRFCVGIRCRVVSSLFASIPVSGVVCVPLCDSSLPKVLSLGLQCAWLPRAGLSGLKLGHSQFPDDILKTSEIATQLSRA